MKITGTISSVSELSNAISNAYSTLGGTGRGTELWWRGQRSNNPNWTLRPKIYRDEDYDEATLALNFKNLAKTRYNKCPPNDDLSGWLFLMQHYGLPTRLLDWTKSPLIATFFAIEEDEKSNNDAGVLWALSPGDLNYAQHNTMGVFAPTHGVAKDLIEPAFESEKAKERRQIIIAIDADQIDYRMLIQQSAFTIHSNKLPMDQLESEDKFLLKFEIPNSAKADMRVELKNFGFELSYLFPDLEHLACELKDTKVFRPYTK